MASAYKILGQVNPSANTLSNVYVTGASASAVISSLTVSNQTSSNASYSIVVRPVSESLAAKHYILRGAVAPGSDTVIITSGITMGSDVILAANAATSTLSFSAYGTELT